MAQEQLRRLAKLGWIPVALAALYVGWIFWQRHSSGARYESQAAQEAAEQDKKILEKLGGDRLTILSFYGPPVVRRGEAALLCYGVSNADEVRIEPTVPDVFPSLSRCVEVRPSETTKFTLIASTKSGEEKQAEVTLRVE
jgi:hypothetical protein